METIGFLHRVFPLTTENAKEFVRFLAVSEESPWPGQVTWKTIEELHQLSSSEDASALGFQTKGMDVFFTPHTFTRKDPYARVTKEDAGSHSQTCWIECDDEHLDPELFKPTPHLIVETSPHRHHAYWFLNSPTPTDLIEETNWRLIHGNHLKQDTGGWALTKLLRLPGTTSHKRTQPFQIKVVSYHEKVKRYSVPDSFKDLLEVPENFRIIREEGFDPLPDLDSLPTRRELEAEFAFPAELNDILTRERDDRSSALWRAYNLCYRLNMSEKETFALLRDTPNDKFTKTWRFNQDAGLWNDIVRGFRAAKNPEDTPILLAIQTIRTTKEIPADAKKEKIARAIFKDMIVRGRVYFDPEKKMALYYDGEKVIEMEKTNLDWKVLLIHRYSVVNGNPDFTAINELLYGLAAKEGEIVKPHRFSHYDKVRNLLYVYNGGGKVYRLDGQVCETSDNGSDGVLFLEEHRNEPFEPTPPPLGYTPPTLRETIFSIPNYEDSSETHTAKEAADIAEAWFYSMFFDDFMEVRPHLVVTGSTDSGKTMIFQQMQELMVGKGQTVTSLPTDRANFEMSVSNSHHLFFDNVDTPNKWLQDAIAECATGIQFDRRVLYTTNTKAHYNVKCFLGLTTRDAWFSREDVATRLIVLNTQRRTLKLMSNTLHDRIRDNRNYLWHEAITQLNRIVARMANLDPEARVNLRIASFQLFLGVWCDVNGVDGKRLEQIVKRQQVGTALENSIVFEMLNQWLTRRHRESHILLNNGRKVDADVLHRELRAIANEQGAMRAYDIQIKNPRALGRKLKELSNDLSGIAEMEIVRTKPKGIYKFTLVNPMSWEEEVEALANVPLAAD